MAIESAINNNSNVPVPVPVLTPILFRRNISRMYRHCLLICFGAMAMAIFVHV